MVGAQGDGYLLGDGIGIGIQQLSFMIVGDRRYHDRQSPAQQVVEESGIDPVDISRKSVIDISPRSFMALYGVAIRAADAYGIALMRLQLRHDIFIDVPGIYHGNDLKRFGVGNAPALDHLLGDAHLAAKLADGTQATIYLAPGDYHRVHAPFAAEVLEVVIHGDLKTSKVVGRRIGDVALPEGAAIAAIIRGEEVLIAHHDTLIETEDHLIVFALNKRIIPKVEKLFQVGFGFF